MFDAHVHLEKDDYSVEWLSYPGAVVFKQR